MDCRCSRIFGLYRWHMSSPYRQALLAGRERRLPPAKRHSSAAPIPHSSYLLEQSAADTEGELSQVAEEKRHWRTGRAPLLSLSQPGSKAASGGCYWAHQCPLRVTERNAPLTFGPLTEPGGLFPFC